MHSWKVRVSECTTFLQIKARGITVDVRGTRARRDDERGNMREGVLRTWLREGSELDAGSARRAWLWEIRPNPEARPRDLACYATFASDCFMHAAAACRLVQLMGCYVST